MGFASRLARPYRLKKSGRQRFSEFLHSTLVTSWSEFLRLQTALGCRKNSTYFAVVRTVISTSVMWSWLDIPRMFAPQVSAGAVVSAVRLYEAFSSSPAHLGKHG
jgi:hypothetical protein